MGGDPIPTFCPLCVSRCGARATVEDGTLLALAPDPSHPTGKALCLKGKAAPDIVYHSGRLLHPMRRTTPKDAPDPGWEQITWDEALDTVAERLRAVADSDGPEAVAFSASSPSTSAISDSVDWIQRLIRAFGSPNFCVAMELCGWGRYLAPLYTYGASVPGVYLPDLENAGCILFWGYNPSVARLAHATSTVAAVARGAKLVVVDPRKAGLAARADQWLRVRPGTDAALALSMTHVMIENGWYDADFVRDWTNASARVEEDTVWDLLAARCAEYPPDVAAEITGVPAEQIVATAKTLWESRPVAFYTWSGLEQHSGTTQTIRAINVLYALTGSLDVSGGNVLFEEVPANRIDGIELLSRSTPPAVGLETRPLGTARYGFVTGEDFYTAALDRRIKALVGFGGNLVMAHGDSARGRDALRNLDFFVQMDLFMTPTAELADVVVPVTTPFEAEALKIGFEYSQEAQSLVQLRRQLVAPRGEARSDLRIVFDLATRLGLGEHFWAGDIEAAWRHQLAPSGITLEELRAHPEGVRVPLTTRHRKYAETGFATPSAQGGALLDHAGRARLRPPAGLRGAADQPALAARPRRALPPGAQLREVAVLLRDPAPTGGRPAQECTRPAAGDPPLDGAGARDLRRRLGLPGDPAGQRPGAREAQRQPRPAGRLRPARLVGGVRGAGAARLSAVRPGQREPQPGADPDPERPDQRELTAAGGGVRGVVAGGGGWGVTWFAVLSTLGAGPIAPTQQAAANPQPKVALKAEPRYLYATKGCERKTSWNTEPSSGTSRSRRHPRSSSR